MPVDLFVAAGEHRRTRIACFRLHCQHASSRAGKPVDDAPDQGRFDIAFDLRGVVNAERARIFGDAQIFNAARLAGQPCLQ